MKKKKICFITGSRAEYGMQHFLMKKIIKDKKFIFKLIVTGTHFSKKFGYTYKEITKDKFKADVKCKILSISKNYGVIKTTSNGIIKINKALIKIKPDMLILVGDRYEIFAAAFAALVNRIPIAHIHGGETTYGAFDESLRHAITKMSSWHFVSNQKYKNRIIQLGENPKNIFITGGLGVDSIKKSKLLKREYIERKYKINLQKKTLLITYHSETLSKNYGVEGFNSLLKVLSEMKNLNLLFTVPNSDTGNEKIRKMIFAFKSKYPKKTKIFNSLGRVDFFSLLKNIDAIVGNSSSGILEAPTLKIGTINIGDRQSGRLMAKSIVSCKANYGSIKNAINKIFSKKFKNIVKKTKNPYDQGDTAKNIHKILLRNRIPYTTIKPFFDLKF